MTPAHSVAIVIPVYQPRLTEFEQFSVDRSAAVLHERQLFFIAPRGLDTSYYRERYPRIPFELFDAPYFASIQGYNHLLLGRELYQRFGEHEFLMILQTDAIIFRDEIDQWSALPYDYVGAPWPNAFELLVNLDRFEGDHGKHVRTAVGNGGLSLRRIRKTLDLFDDFPNAVEVYRKTSSSEDLFFAVMGTLATDFVMPNEVTASLFSMELKPSHYYHINGNRLPMGAHAWWKYEPEFWHTHIPGMPAVRPA